MNIEVRNFFEDSARELGIELTDIQFSRFAAYADFLLDWNSRMNLTAITEPREIIQKHFIDSMTVLPYIRGERLIDVGTGCGLPGVALKIMREELSVTLLDSQRKRIDFLAALGEKLGFTRGYEPVHSRAEDLARNLSYRDGFDTAIARAVAATPVLLEFCLPFVKPGGVFIAMKGTDEPDETEVAQAELNAVLAGKTELTLPRSTIARTVYVFEKTEATPDRYPRRTARIMKEPL